MLDVRAWTLLADVISSRNTSLPLNTRPVKAWLMPILNRIPFAPITICLLNFLPSLDPGCRRQLTLVVRRCLMVIWPIAVQRLGSDTLLDCFGAILVAFNNCELDESLVQIGIFITSSYRTCLGNCSNKKKACLLADILFRNLFSSSYTHSCMQRFFNAICKVGCNVRQYRPTIRPIEHCSKIYMLQESKHSLVLKYYAKFMIQNLTTCSMKTLEIWLPSP